MLLAAAVLSAACGGADPARRDDTAPATRVPSPQRPVELTLPRLGGGSVSLSELRGRPVLLALFTTWDLRCTAEAPIVSRLADSHGPRGLAVLGVALGPLGTKGLPMVRAYVEELGVGFPVLLSDPDDPDLWRALGPVRQVPRTLLLDRAGRVALDMEGQTDFVQLTRVLEGLL